MDINKPEGGSPIAKQFQTLKDSFSNPLNNGHRYMMIKNGEMHLTDKKNRSSLSEINKFMESVFKDETLSNEEKLAILSSYHTLTNNDAFDYALEKQDFEMIKLFAQYVDPKIVKEKFKKHMKEINTLLNSNDEIEKNKKINLLLSNLGTRCGNGFSHTYDQRNKYHEVFFLDVDQAFSEKNLTQIKEFMEEKLN